MAEKIVVIGGNSYIGNHFAGYAAAQGADVLRVTSKDCNFLDPDAVSRFFASLGDTPCVVVFLAVINKSAENDYAAFNKNNLIAKHFVDGQRLADVRSVVWFSSVDVYGAHPRTPITEDTPIAPDTWYGLAKYNGEWMVSASGEVACPVTVLRIPGIFGNSPNDRSVIGRMTESARLRGRVVIHGTGRVRRDFVSIDDVARLVSELIPLRHRGVLNVATGTSVTIREVAEQLRATLGEDFEIVHQDSDPGREFDLCFDNRRLSDVLPDFRFTEIAAGMATYRRDRAS